MVLALVTFCIFIFLHWLFANLFALKGLKLLLILVVVAGFAGRTWVPINESTIEFLSVYSMLFMLYLHFYVGVDRSVSLRIMNELLEQPNRSLAKAELEKLYPKDEMFKHRIKLMVEHDWLQLTDEKYFLKAKAKNLVLFIKFLRTLYNLNSTW